MSTSASVPSSPVDARIAERPISSESPMADMTRLPVFLELPEQAEPVETAMPASEKDRARTSPDKPGRRRRKSKLDLKAPGKARSEYEKGYQLLMAKNLDVAITHLVNSIANLSQLCCRA